MFQGVWRVGVIGLEPMSDIFKLKRNENEIPYLQGFSESASDDKGVSKHPFFKQIYFSIYFSISTARHCQYIDLSPLCPQYVPTLSPKCPQ